MPEITIEFARTLYENADAAHAFDHVLRVTRLAVRIAEVEGADVAIVRTAALLHDVADERRDHHLVGVQRARELLADAPPRVRGGGGPLYRSPSFQRTAPARHAGGAMPE